MDERLIDFVTHVRTHPGISSASVAEHFGVSVRTVRNWLHEANEALDGAAAITSDHGSYTLVMQSRARFERLISVGNSIWSRTPSTSDRRAAYLLSNLLFRSDWVTIDALAEALFVTRRTISTSLKTVEAELEAYGLRLERRSHHGIRVQGDELARRRCLARLISVNADLSRSPLSGGYAVIGNTTVGELSSCVREVLDAQSLAMSGTAFRSLLVHLCISLGRAGGEAWGPIDSDVISQLKSLAVYSIRAIPRPAHRRTTSPPRIWTTSATTSTWTRWCTATIRRALSTGWRTRGIRLRSSPVTWRSWPAATRTSSASTAMATIR